MFFSQNHRRLEGDLLRSNCLLKQGHLELMPRTMSGWLLNICKDGDSTNSLLFMYINKVFLLNLLQDKQHPTWQCPHLSCCDSRQSALGAHKADALLVKLNLECSLTANGHFSA